MRKKAAESTTPKQQRSALAGVAKAFSAFRPAREVLKVVRAVPTRFVQLDHATRVGGFPLDRFTVMHGPSNEGKSLCAIGLIDSFLALDHFAFYIDAERTTPITWLHELMGDRAEHPGFFANRPDSYEKTIAEVRNFLNLVATLKKAGKVPAHTSAIVVCDSLRKLVPEDQMAEILKAAKQEAEEERKSKGKKGKRITAGRDRSAQIKAKMNAAWMDELVPLLEHAGASFVAIAREMEDPDASAFARMYGTNYKVGGGSAIIYDSSFTMRVERASWVSEKGEDEEGPGQVYGERHRVTIKKTKIGGKEGRTTVCHFHSSNGKLVPAGFDRARDVLDLGVQFGIVKLGSWSSWGQEKHQRVQGGAHRAVEKLTADPAALAELEARVRAMFEKQVPVEVDMSTGEVLT